MCNLLGTSRTCTWTATIATFKTLIGFSTFKAILRLATNRSTGSLPTRFSLLNSLSTVKLRELSRSKTVKWGRTSTNAARVTDRVCRAHRIARGEQYPAANRTSNLMTSSIMGSTFTAFRLMVQQRIMLMLFRRTKKLWICLINSTARAVLTGTTKITKDLWQT